MDIPHLPSQTRRVYDQTPSFERRSKSRTFERVSPPSFPSKGAMPIRNASLPNIPPPLPPPRFNQSLAQGNDLGWKFGNQKSTLAPIRQGSSLCGGYMQPRLNTNVGSEDQPGELEMQLPSCNGGAVTTLSPSSRSDIHMSTLGATVGDDRRKPVSPSSIANQRLQGEKPLAQQNFQHSAEAYDKSLLSKIGKTDSPPRHPSLVSRGVTASVHSRPLHPSDGNNLQRLSVTDVAPATTSFDLSSRWATSPASAGISPASKSSWRDYAEYRSSSVDSSAPSSVVDSDQHTRLRELGRRSVSGLQSGNDDSSSLLSRSNRGSYDQQAFVPDLEPCFPLEETGSLRKLELVDRTPPHNSYRQLISKQQGLKRRALSPPRESARDDKASTSGTNQVAELHQRALTGHGYSRSPNSRLHPTHSSVSSTSSASFRNGSYASSVGWSVAGSSMTSVSSLERPSPAGTPPSSELDPLQDAAPVHAKSLNAPSGNSHPIASRSHLSQNPPESRSAGVARAMSAQATSNSGKARSAPRIAGAFMCECCTKKPKKFESEDELRMHMLEKQYKCAFCHNRFKNKNEAERHQNSLHLRRHSWSCAAISGYEAAFHPSTSSGFQSANGSSNDACGYCGVEFSNLPRDWDARIDHLTSVHKFRECSQTKKFFRADHFRQHLKHSHAGTSGKWTNMLENACMKDEPNAESPVTAGPPADGAEPSISQQSTTPEDTMEEDEDV